MLSERQKLILAAIVENYIHIAEPVGSRTISKREEINFSSATIRNEMADLEELGYLEQPHTSAGRIPSQKGYRFYVDHLIKPHLLSSVEIANLKNAFAQKMYEIEQVIQHTAYILSSLTNYTSIVLGPEVYQAALKHFQIVPMSSNKAVAIIVTDTGKVEHKVISVPEEISIGEIEKVVNILNTKLVGIPLTELKHRLYSEIAVEMQKHVDHYEKMIQAIEDAIRSRNDDRVYLGGTTKIMSQPEFRDVEKVKGILELLEETDKVIQLFSLPDEGIQVRIGTENSIEEVSNCSIITASYHLNGKPIGRIGILGPTRMEYGKMIAIIDYLSKDLSRLLSDLYNNEFNRQEK
ncbi:heat-inducible transcriptional repressor HrcA [Bacillaceae bacterium]